MLKTCPSCSYVGNDWEHVCPFCKADLAVGRPRRERVRHGSHLTCDMRSSSGSSAWMTDHPWMMDHLLPRSLVACYRAADASATMPGTRTPGIVSDASGSRVPWLLAPWMIAHPGLVASNI